jgi:hypothetical protein
MPLIGFLPSRGASVLYGVAGCSGAKAMLAKLSKHTTGKGCLYIKKLTDVDLEVLEAMVKHAVAATRGR